MKLNFKITTLLLISLISFLFIYNSYDNRKSIDKKIDDITLTISKSLANLAISYKKASIKHLDKSKKNLPKNSDTYFYVDDEKYDPKNSIFTRFYNLNNSNFQIGMIRLNEKKHEVLSENIKNYLKHKKENPNAKYFFKEITHGRYFFATPIDNIKIQDKNLFYVVTVNINNSKLKDELITEYKKNLLKDFLILLITIFAIYAIFRNLYGKNISTLKSLKKEVKRQNQTIIKQDKEMTYRLYNDTLTNLPNRNQLIADLENFDSNVTIALINLDNFKETNDFYGYEIGDEVLISFAGLLKLYSKDFSYDIYKLHADEYGILWKNLDREVAEKYIIQLLKSIKNFSVITEDECSIEVTATMGIAVGSANSDNILAHADMVLKRAKIENLSYLFFESSMDIEKEYKYNIEWAKKIRLAIKNNKIISYAQPIVNTEDKSFIKYEMLVRMIDDNGEIISPFAFLEIAKRNKLYSFITRHMIEESFNYFDDTDLHFAINISILDILNPVTVSFIISRLKRLSNPKRVTFELLESEGIENYDKVSSFIEQVKSFGCRIAIDDFGSGYSNFEYMLRLKVDLIKIDSSLIKDIDKNQNAQVIVKTIVSFAKSLGIKTCAEFVHNESVYNTVKEIGTTYIQGYYISEPFPITDIKKGIVAK